MVFDEEMTTTPAEDQNTVNDPMTDENPETVTPESNIENEGSEDSVE